MTTEESEARSAEFDLLARTETFADLPASLLQSLAASVEWRRFDEGEHIVTEGAVSDAVFVIQSGKVEIVALRRDGTYEPVAVVTAGEAFGEVGLILGHGERTASGIALGSVTALRLPAEAFREAVRGNAGFRERIRALTEVLEGERLVRAVTPLSSLDADARRRLARAATHRTFEPGATLFREGEPGDSCFLILKGKLNLTRGSPAGSVATVGIGTIVGESAMLTTLSRAASAVALERTDVLELTREQVEATLNQDPHARRRMLQLVRLRHRPLKRPGMELHEKETPEGDTVAVLRDPVHHRYFRLSKHGLFVWERLDGEHNVRDLALEGMQRFGSFDPESIARLIARLQTSGFVLDPFAADMTGATASPVWRRVAAKAYRSLTWMREIPQLDAITTAIYRYGGRALFTPIAQIVLAGLALAGPVALASSADRASSAVGDTGGAGWAFLLGFVIAAPVHDAGHALATKHYGRRARGGVGFFWFSPILYVDTSEMWLGSRRQRIIVTVAGPYAHLILAGVVGIATMFIEDGFWLVLLWDFALLAYGDVLLNLSPLLELDGYYLWVHILNRPNLRQRSLAYLANLPRALRERRGLRGHALEMTYGILSLVFVAVLSLFAILLYRLGVQPWLAESLSPEMATMIGWAVGGVIAVATVAAVIGDMQRAKQALLEG